MEYGFRSRAGRFLQEQKKHRRWMMGFLCLAGGVTLGTLAFLKLYGQAMTHQVKVLECRYEVHEHAEGCYEEDEDGRKVLVCGYADYVIHVHNDDCYDRKGALVCPLEEHELHEHTDDCYGEEEILVCGKEETGDVEDPEEADAEEEAQAGEEQPEETAQTETVLACGKEEHTHTDGCYPEGCGLSEHTHSGDCNREELTCSESEHEHGDRCYEDGELTCSKDEHSHGGGCYTITTCPLEEHTHSNACSSSAPVCGMEEHIHNDGCYEERTAGTTEVPKAEAPEITKHVHTDDCYEVEEGLICGEQELHIHDDSCYDEDCFDEDGNLIEGSHVSCGLLQLEEHVHTEECFQIVELTAEEVAALNQGATLHVHDESCYDEDGKLICGHEVTHIHGLDCYDDDGKLICGLGVKEETHEHDANCYDEEGNLTCGRENAKDHEHDADCYDEEGNRVCGYRGVKDHEHGTGCYDEDGNLICGYEGAKDHEHRAECYDIFGNLICGYEDAADHVHTEDCYDEDGNLICGYDVRVIYEQSKIYECDKYVVIARYNNDAELPEEAEFLAEEITPETDEEHYANREAECQEMMGDETATMKALLRIGFYLDEDGERTEVEPKTPVELAVQFLDEDGLTEGRIIKIIHFSEDGTEKLDGSDAKDNSTTFTMESFSDAAIMVTQLTSEDAEPQPLKLNETFEYEADPFLITFHVEGTPKDMTGKAVMVAPLVTEEPGEDNEMSEEEGVVEEGGDLSDAAEEEIGMVSEALEENVSATETTEDISSEMSDETENNDENMRAVSNNPDLQFDVVSVDNPEVREALAKYLGESDETVSRRVLHTLSYTLSYKGEQLDLSECTVTAKITLGKASEKTEDANAEEEERTEEGEAFGNEIGESEESEEVTTADGDAGEVFDEEEAEGDVSDMESFEDAGLMLTADEDAASVVAAYQDALEIPEGRNVDVTVSVLEVTAENQVSLLGYMSLDNNSSKLIKASLKSNTVAFSQEVEDNPLFTVQYYAYLQVMDEDKKATAKNEGTGYPTDIAAVPLIDTSNGGKNKGGNLPKNQLDLPVKNLYIERTSGNGFWSVYKPITKESLLKIYMQDKYNLMEYPYLENFNKFAKEGLNYDLCEIWVLKKKHDPESIKEDDWDIYRDNVEAIEFTNNPSKAEEGKVIFIEDGTILRLVGRSNRGGHDNDVTFYDYDITDGKVYEDAGLTKPTTNREVTEKLYARVFRQGINTSEVEDAPRIGFGNALSGVTGVGTDMLDGFNINQRNTNVYGNCSFGLAQEKLGGDGYPIFNVAAPDMFGPTKIDGKTAILGKSLQFDRVGDTYTLTSVNGCDLNDLDKFIYTGKAWVSGDVPMKDRKDMFVNQFWPMDSAPTFGEEGHDLKFGSSDYQQNRNAVGSNSTDTTQFNASDDKQDHNSFFGMTFSVEFKLTQDYCGPLNYYFFGDDDMWVYLDEKLICDIGGVHQAAGEYVDLWDWIEQGSEESAGTHTLKFFYTERGASGSTCWMQFTLPSTNSVPVTYPTGDCKNTLKVSKSVSGADTDEEFGFTIDFYGALTSNKKLNNYYNYVIVNESNEEIRKGSITSGETFKLGNKQSIIIRNMPDGAYYTITENSYDGFKPEVNGSKGIIKAGQTTTGTIDWTRDDVVNYVNQSVPYELPETGGPGAEWYMLASAVLLLFGAGLIYSKKFSERRV